MGDESSSPFFFTDYVYKWLDNALDYGITERDFWDMTLAELNRLIASKERVRKQEAKERATFDYILADLIGRSIGRIYSSSAKMPDINEAYSTLFDGKKIEEQKMQKKQELSVIRFKQFAEKYNKNFRSGGGNE